MVYFVPTWSLFAGPVTYLKINYTVVWEKFTVRYFHVKFFCGKTFLSLGISNNKFLQSILGQTFCSIAYKLNTQLYISFNMHFAQAKTHNDN